MQKYPLHVFGWLPWSVEAVQMDPLSQKEEVGTCCAEEFVESDCWTFNFVEKSKDNKNKCCDIISYNQYK